MVAHHAIIGVDGLVGLPTLGVDKLPVNEQLMRHLYGHVVDVLLHLRNSQNNSRKRVLSKPNKNPAVL